MPRAGGSAAGPERMLVAHGRPSPVAAEVRTPEVVR